MLGARNAVIQFRPSSFRSSVIRASVIIPRSPTHTTRFTPNRSRTFPIADASVEGSAAFPSNTSTATGRPSTSHNSPNTICSLSRFPSRLWPYCASGQHVPSKYADVTS